MGHPGPERLSELWLSSVWREVGWIRGCTMLGYLLIIALESQFCRLLQRVA